MTSETKHASARSHRSRDDGGIVGVIPYLVVLVCAVAGLYIAWRQGSAGGGRGAVVGGIALLVGAGVRLALPTRLAGLLEHQETGNRRAHARRLRRRPGCRGPGTAELGPSGSVRGRTKRGAVSFSGARKVS